MYVAFEALNIDALALSYTGNRALKEDEQKHLFETLVAFIDTWKSHGAALHASTLVDQVGPTIFVDESKQTLSGCARDCLIHCLKTWSINKNIDLFNPFMWVIQPTKTSLLKWQSLQQLARKLAQQPCAEQVPYVYEKQLATKEMYLKKRLVPLFESSAGPYIRKLIKKTILAS